MDNGKYKNGTYQEMGALIVVQMDLPLYDNAQ